MSRRRLVLIFAAGDRTPHFLTPRATGARGDLWAADALRSVLGLPNAI